MVCVEGICAWFKGLEGEARIEVMCSLLDSCLPLELRFLGTYVEYIAGRYYTHLQRWEKTANSGPFEELHNLNDTKVRRTLCVFLTLLYSHNRRAASKLFQILSNSHTNGPKYMATNSEQKSNESTVDTKTDSLIYLNELKLLLCMASHHPAFDFNQKQMLRVKMQGFESGKHGACYWSGECCSNVDMTSSEVRTATKKERREKYDQAERTVDTPYKLEPAKPSIKPLLDVSLGTTGIETIPGDCLGNLHDGYHLQSPKMSLDCKASFGDPFIGPGVSLQNHYYQGHPLPSPVAHIAGQVLTSKAVTVLSPNTINHGTSTIQGPVMHPVQAKAALRAAPNGIIQPMFQSAIYNGNHAPPPAAFGEMCPDGRLRCPSAPIPVRSPRMYHQYPQAPYASVRANNVTFAYGISPLDSPCQSPFTSPLPSPITSPRPSPAQSPMFRRRSTGGISANKKEVQNFSSVYDWLKSLRLHKYTEVFKDYTFDKMVALTESDLIALGLTQGARKKFKLNVDALVERGFQGFGIQTCASIDCLSNDSEAPTQNKDGNAVNNALVASSSSSLNSNNSSSMSVTSSSEYNNNLRRDCQNTAVCPGQLKESDHQYLKESNCTEKSSDEASQGTEESLDEVTSDDEVFMTRRQTVIEIQDYTSAKLPKDNAQTCYNCGLVGHLGNVCEEETMEAQAYNRYAFRLRYNPDEDRTKKPN